jgi:hypothetical protein
MYHYKMSHVKRFFANKTQIGCMEIATDDAFTRLTRRGNAILKRSSSSAADVSPKYRSASSREPG